MLPHAHPSPVLWAPRWLLAFLLLLSRHVSHMALTSPVGHEEWTDRRGPEHAGSPASPGPSTVPPTLWDLKKYARTGRDGPPSRRGALPGRAAPPSSSTPHFLTACRQLCLGPSARFAGLMLSARLPSCCNVGLDRARSRVPSSSTWHSKTDRSSSPQRILAWSSVAYVL